MRPSRSSSFTLNETDNHAEFLQSYKQSRAVFLLHLKIITLVAMMSTDCSGGGGRSPQMLLYGERDGPETSQRNTSDRICSKTLCGF